MTIRTILSTGLLLGTLAACGSKDVILPGERLDIRDGLASAPATEVNQSRPISLGTQVANADWTNPGGSSTHFMRHLALSATPQLAFAADIGEGNSRRARISTAPVVAGGVIYTIDAANTVVATGTNGARLWAMNFAPVADQGDASGGELAVGGGKLFVSTPYGDLIALDPATGTEIWRQDLNASGASSATYANGVVYIVGHDNRAWAIEADTGVTRWTFDGIDTDNSFGDGTGVAVSGDYALFPLAGGRLAATYRNGGTERWVENLGGERLGYARGLFDGLTGGPVVTGNTVYLSNTTGVTVALDLRNGDRRWTAHEGAAGPVWPIGGSVFEINDLNEVLRLDAGDGSVIWRTALPDLIPHRRNNRERVAVAHYGPVIAGGRVIVASSDGVIRQLDPVSGQIVGQIELPGGAASAPVVAGGTLYVVSKDGQLLAFR